MDGSDDSLGLGLNDFLLSKGLEENILHAIESEVQVLYFPAGATLFSQGDQGDCLYGLASGQLEISVCYPDGSQFSIDILEPGAILGEIAILTGQVRTATARAIVDCKLYRLSRDSFDRLADLYPILEDRLANVMSLNINRLISTQVIRHLFGNLDPLALRELDKNFSWQHLKSGEMLYHQGEPGDSMAIVISGRLQVVVEGAGKSHMVAELQRGMIIGEISLLTGVARTATVYAVRETDLIVLTRDRFEVLIQQYPVVMREISRTLAERLNHNTQILAREQPQHICIALVPGSSAAQMSNLAEHLKQTLSIYGPVLHLNSDSFASLYPRRHAISSESETRANPLIESWLDEQESHFSYLLLETDRTWTPWTERCIGHADTIYFVVQAKDSLDFNDIKTRIHQSSSRAQLELVLIHQNDQAAPQDTETWLQKLPFTRHHHIRSSSVVDYRRLARRIARRSTGLVLSGGGARGFAHLGVYRALLEAGIEIDVIGGTSMGALLGAAIAHFEDYQLLIDEASMFSSTRVLMDYTFPITALNATRKITDLLRNNFGQTRIEDLWRPFFCVSTDLSSLQPVIHRTGLLWEAVRASIAIPGVFAPISKNGHLLVDGGLVDNMPIDIMREICESGLVIAVNVAQAQEAHRYWDFAPSVSGWRVLFNKLNPFAKPMQVPSLTDTLMRTIDLVTQFNLRESLALADLVIVPQVDHINPLQWEAWKEGVDLGYQAAQHALEGWQRSF